MQLGTSGEKCLMAVVANSGGLVVKSVYLPCLTDTSAGWDFVSWDLQV